MNEAKNSKPTYNMVTFQFFTGIEDTFYTVIGIFAVMLFLSNRKIHIQYYSNYFVSLLLYRKFLKLSQIVYNRFEIKNGMTKE